MARAKKNDGKVLLVGSVNLDSVDQVFKTAGRILGPCLERIPDGEPGPRSGWISFNYAGLRVHRAFEPDPEAGLHTGVTLLRLRKDAKKSDMVFGELGYAREAKGSYVDFVAARKAGTIPKGVRFQVCLPTPFAVTVAFFSAATQPVAEKMYEAALIREIKQIAAAIPRRDLSIQLDICHDMVAWDGRFAFTGGGTKTKDAMVAAIRRLSNAVPRGVELGYHLCYGDFRGRHFVEPEDAGCAVDFANALSKAVKRPIAWIHMPVPENRSDARYFAPLARLRLHKETELFLGLVHLDGAAATRRRIAAAKRYAPRFGVATECGMGRKWGTAQIPALMRVHAEVAAEAWS
jgi:methionine synthase II (cobalamin-independent)